MSGDLTFHYIVLETDIEKLYADLQRRYIAQQRKLKRLIIELAQYTHNTLTSTTPAQEESLSTSPTFESEEKIQQIINTSTVQTNNNNIVINRPTCQEPTPSSMDKSSLPLNTSGVSEEQLRKQLSQLESRLLECEKGIVPLIENSNSFDSRLMILKLTI